MLCVYDLFCKEYVETLVLGSIKNQGSKRIIKDLKINISLILKKKNVFAIPVADNTFFEQKCVLNSVEMWLKKR